MYTRHRPQRLLMVCLLPPPAPVGIPLYLLRYRTCCFDVALLVAAHFLSVSRGPPAPSFDAVLAAVMPARMLPGVV